MEYSLFSDIFVGVYFLSLFSYLTLIFFLYLSVFLLIQKLMVLAFLFLLITFIFGRLFSFSIRCDFFVFTAYVYDLCFSLSIFCHGRTRKKTIKPFPALPPHERDGKVNKKSTCRSLHKKTKENLTLIQTYSIILAIYLFDSSYP